MIARHGICCFLDARLLLPADQVTLWKRLPIDLYEVNIGLLTNVDENLLFIFGRVQETRHLRVYIDSIERIATHPHSQHRELAIWGFEKKPTHLIHAYNPIELVTTPLEQVLKDLVFDKFGLESEGEAQCDTSAVCQYKVAFLQPALVLKEPQQTTLLCPNPYHHLLVRALFALLIILGAEIG